LEEAAAIARCQAGDRDAFRYLVAQHQAEALGHAGAMLGWTDAPDAVQDAFVDAWAALPRFEAGRKFYPWFYTILRNRCLKRIAARKGRGEEELTDALLVESTSAGGRMEAAALGQALERLTAEEREIVMLRHLDGLSYEQLAERLTIPTGTVMSRLFYARRKLRTLIGTTRAAARQENT
jgi:RNA polymerase sigma-70 factor, ECF subfamily